MAPIHDSDVGEERWNASEWANYELWEKVESRMRRKKRVWILITSCLVFILSAIPIVLDRSVKWQTRSAVRTFAQAINHLKREASVKQAPHRFRLVDHQGKLDFVVERVDSCQAQEGKLVLEGSAAPQTDQGQLVALSGAQGEQLGLLVWWIHFAMILFGGRGLSQGKRS